MTVVYHLVKTMLYNIFQNLNKTYFYPINLKKKKKLRVGQKKKKSLYLFRKNQRQYLGLATNYTYIEALSLFKFWI